MRERWQDSREQMRQMQQRVREQQQALQEQQRQLIREHHAEIRNMHRGRRGRGVGGQQRPHLSREEVVRAALAIVDREGLEGFSMRKLGAELGVDPMAVYYYFPNKAAVLDGIVDALHAEVQPELDPHAPWDDRLRTLARAQAAVLRAHPHALPAIATHPPFTETSIRQVEAAASILHAAGLSPWDAVAAVESLSSYLIGAALAEVGLQPGGVADPTMAEVQERIAQLPPDEFPILTAALRDWEPSIRDGGFDESLEIFIAGLKARYASVLGTPHTDTAA